MHTHIRNAMQYNEEKNNMMVSWKVVYTADFTGNYHSQLSPGSVGNYLLIQYNLRSAR